MNSLETQALNDWLAYLKAKTIQPTLAETESFIVLCQLTTSYKATNLLASIWLNQAVENGVLVVNPHPHPYKLKEGN